MRYKELLKIASADYYPDRNLPPPGHFIPMQPRAFYPQANSRAQRIQFHEDIGKPETFGQRIFGDRVDTWKDMTKQPGMAATQFRGVYRNLKDAQKAALDSGDKQQLARVRKALTDHRILFGDLVNNAYPNLKDKYGRRGPRYLNHVYDTLMALEDNQEQPDVGIEPWKGSRVGSDYVLNTHAARTQGERAQQAAFAGLFSEKGRQAYEQASKQQKAAIAAANKNIDEYKQLPWYQKLQALSTAAAYPVAMSAAPAAVPFLARQAIFTPLYMLGDTATSLGMDQLFRPVINRMTTDINQFSSAILQKNNEAIPERFRKAIATGLGISQDQVDLADPQHYKKANQLFVQGQKQRQTYLDRYIKAKPYVRQAVGAIGSGLGAKAFLKVPWKSAGGRAASYFGIGAASTLGDQLFNPRKKGLSTGAIALRLKLAQENGEDDPDQILRQWIPEDQRKTAWQNFEQYKASGMPTHQALFYAITGGEQYPSEEEKLQRVALHSEGVTPAQQATIQDAAQLSESPVIKQMVTPYVPDIVQALKGQGELPDLNKLLPGDKGSVPIDEKFIAAGFTHIFSQPQVQQALLQASPQTLNKLIAQMQGLDKDTFKKMPVLQRVMKQTGFQIAEARVDALQQLVQSQEDDDKAYRTMSSELSLLQNMSKLGGPSDDPRAAQLQKRFRDLVGTRMTRNPLFVNKAMALWAQANGHSSFASFLASNAKFYGTAAALIGLPLTIALLRSLFGGSSQQPRQAPMQYAPQGYQPMAYAPKGITDRGLVVG